MNKINENFLTCTLGTGLQLFQEGVKLYSTKEVCEITGVTRRALGFYVKKGLINPPVKSGDGEHLQYNYYDNETVKRLIEIKCLTGMKIPLCDIKKIIENKNTDEKIDNMIDELIQKRDELNEFIEKLSDFKNKNSTVKK